MRGPSLAARVGKPLSKGRYFLFRRTTRRERISVFFSRPFDSRKDLLRLRPIGQWFAVFHLLDIVQPERHALVTSVNVKMGIHLSPSPTTGIELARINDSLSIRTH